MRQLFRSLLQSRSKTSASVKPGVLPPAPPERGGQPRAGVRGKPLTMSEYQQLWATAPSFSAFLPWADWLHKSRCLLLEDGRSVGAVYELTAVTTEGRPAARLDEIRDQVEDALQNALDGLDTHPWVIQFFCQDERDPQAWVNHIRDYIRPAARDSAFTEAWLENMARHYRVVSRAGGIFKDDQVTGIQWQGRRRRIRMVLYRMIGEKGSLRQAPEAQLNQTCDRLCAALTGTGVRTQRLNGGDIFLWLARWFNPSRDDAFYHQLADMYRPENQDPDLCPLPLDFAEDLIQGSPVSDPENGVWWLDNRPHRVLVASKLTDAPPTGTLTGERKSGDHIRAAFDELPEGTIMALTAIVIPQEPLEAGFNKLRRNAVGENADSMAVRRDAEEAIRWLVERHQIWRMNLSFFINASDLDGLREQENSVTAIVSRYGIAITRPEDLVAPLNAWLRTCPMCFNPADDRHNWYSRLTFVQHIAGLLPIFGRGTGTGHPGMSFFNRGGEPLHFDPLNSLDRNQNAHLQLFGPTGAGKSATLNALFAQLMAVHRPRLFIAEAGNSFGLFADYCETLGLTVNRISIQPGTHVVLAPFADAHRILDDDPGDLDEKEDDDKRDILGEMEIAARLMITGGETEEEKNYRRTDRGMVRRALHETASRCAQANRQMLPEDLRNTLMQMADDHALQEFARRRAQEMASCLDLFTSGFEGEVFNKPGHPWPEVDVTLIDLGHFAREGYEAQMAMAVIALVNRINSLGERDQGNERNIVFSIDEAHLITANPLLAPYVTKASKMWRKLGIWLWLATQNLEDYPDAAKKMLNMCEFWLCLVMPPEEVKNIARFKTLTDEQHEMLLSARKVKGAYTEGVVLSSKLQTLFRVVTPSLYLALGMTEKDEKAARRKRMSQYGCSELEAAFMIAREMDKARGLDADTAHV